MTLTKSNASNPLASNVDGGGDGGVGGGEKGGGGDGAGSTVRENSGTTAGVHGAKVTPFAFLTCTFATTTDEVAAESDDACSDSSTSTASVFVVVMLTVQDKMQWHEHFYQHASALLPSVHGKPASTRHCQAG